MIVKETATKKNYDITINNVSKELGEEATNNLVEYIDSLRNSKTHKPLNYEQKCLLLYMSYKFLKR